MSDFPKILYLSPRLRLWGMLLAGTALVSGASLASAAVSGPVAEAALPATPPAGTVNGAAAAIAGVPEKAWSSEEDQVNFAANTISLDELEHTVTAEGEVEIIQKDKIVRAKKVVYDMNTEKVKAVGDVVMTDKSGDVHFADEVELERKFSNGYIKKLRSVLADGSRISAEEGRRINGTKIVMTRASYTPCEPCKADPSKAPAWQIVADKVTHDKSDHSISYENARLEVHGVPVMYSPYFAHPDGTIKQKSGVLPPKFSLNSQLGLGVATNYYWAIGPSEDATIGAKVFTNVAPQLLGEYRKRFEKAMLTLNTSATYSSHKDTVDNITTATDDKFRGHLFGSGLWEVSDKWRAGFNTQLTTDDQYLRQYDISNEDVLENEIYAERFEGRNYFVGRALAFQDVRTSDRSDDQPNILPEFEASYLGDPNSVLGGRWSFDASGLSLVRKGNGQDVGRVSADFGWQRRDVLSFGVVNTFNANARGDYYVISDRDQNAFFGGDGKSTASRFYPVIHNVTSMPFEKPLDNAQLVIEPTVALTLSTNSKNDTDIPNEDSQDVQIDALNIFNSNRFPGLDRLEDRSHITYGLRNGIYSDNGDMLEAFLGQSFRFENGDNPFPDGSGLSDQKSDVVGQLIANYRDRFTLNYDFQLKSDSLMARRHELDGTAKFGKWTFAGTYLYVRALEGTDLSDNRQQIYGAASYDINEEWRVNTMARYNLSSEDEGLRDAGFGIDYMGQCFSVKTTARRKFTFEDTGDNATEITVSLGLKNLGSFGTNE